MEFEWDDRKAHANAVKHGISFEEAITAFDDPHALLAPDQKHSTSTEVREWLIGEIDTGHVVVVVFTKRGGKKIYRIISVRPASQKERRLYEEYKRISL